VMMTRITCLRMQTIIRSFPTILSSN
jgi:hypothetical protein